MLANGDHRRRRRDSAAERGHDERGQRCPRVRHHAVLAAAKGAVADHLHLVPEVDGRRTTSAPGSGST